MHHLLDYTRPGEMSTAYISIYLISIYINILGFRAAGSSLIVNYSSWLGWVHRPFASSSQVEVEGYV